MPSPSRFRPRSTAASAPTVSAAGHRSKRVSTTAPTAASAAGRPPAGRDQLADGASTRLLLLHRHRHRHRSQERERDEREEPRDVEVEPMRQHELEAYEERSREGGELKGRLATGEERSGDRADDEHRLEPLLHAMEVRDPLR